MAEAPRNFPEGSSLVTRSPLSPIGQAVPPTNDPAWQPPKDATAGNIKARAAVINREIPISTTQTGWEIAQVRGALDALVNGLFDGPAQLVDAIIGDSRVQSAMQSRVGGLLGRELRHHRANDSDAARECYDAWSAHWPAMANEPMLADMLHWSCNLGFWVGQLLWDTTGPVWLPYISPFHPRYTYYHWMLRRLIAITQDGQCEVEPGDGHWILHAPHGRYRGWMRGAVRAIAPWWLARNYALRDWARYSERHGMPIGKAITPSGADQDSIQAFRSALANLGQESILQLPQSDDATFGKYDLEWLETDGSGWAGFQQLIAQCNAEITLAVLGQNLTSEVKEGSFAAARVHADVRQAILESDARALSQTIYTQIARPFAALNFGDPDLAPRSSWDIVPWEDNAALAQTFSAFSIGVSTLKTAGHDVTDIEALGRQFGLSLKVAKIEKAPTNDEKKVP